MESGVCATAIKRSNKYVLPFAQEELHSTGASWPVMMYEEEGFHVASQIHRFALGGRVVWKRFILRSLEIP
jgi:hypothetical protein